MENIMELGTDFKSNWNFNENGDLDLISNTENMIQSITNRINTRLGKLDYFYQTYGSYLHDFLGARRNDKMLEFIKIETSSCLQQDPRIVSFTIDGEYEDEKAKLYVDIYFYDDTDLSLSLVLGEDMVVNVNGD